MFDNNITVVFVDDDEDDRELFEYAAKKANPFLNLIALSNGIELLKYLEDVQTLPDLIILDINMPLMNGLECLARIRKWGRFKSVPVVMYSTSSNEEDLRQALENEANIFVKKPYSIEILIEIIKYLTDLEWIKEIKEPGKLKLLGFPTQNYY